VGRVKRLPLEELAPYLLDVSADAAVLSWGAVFGNDRPVEIEVGCGKGHFLLTSSQARQEVNFLGIEVFRKYQLYSATRMAKRAIANVRLVCADAREFLADRVAAGSVQAIHVYFPDPWWKKRHLKRRLFTPGFAATCERILTPGGRLLIATDVESYFQVITETLAKETKLQVQPSLEVKEATGVLDYLTNFERKYRAEGRAIFQAVYVKEH
jgi:tRNA (guanine-N7-)-methyltransferase